MQGGALCFFSSFQRPDSCFVRRVGTTRFTAMRRVPNSIGAALNRQKRRTCSVKPGEAFHNESSASAAQSRRAVYFFVVAAAVAGVTLSSIGWVTGTFPFPSETAIETFGIVRAVGSFGSVTGISKSVLSPGTARTGAA